MSYPLVFDKDDCLISRTFFLQVLFVSMVKFYSVAKFRMFKFLIQSSRHFVSFYITLLHLLIRFTVCLFFFVSTASTLAFSLASVYFYFLMMILFIKAKHELHTDAMHCFQLIFSDSSYNLYCCTVPIICIAVLSHRNSSVSVKSVHCLIDGQLNSHRQFRFLSKVRIF